MKAEEEAKMRRNTKTSGGVCNEKVEGLDAK
jgi:hypothetical protein